MPGPAVDYDALIAKHGGVVGGAVDYDALIAKHGGVVEQPKTDATNQEGFFRSVYNSGVKPTVDAVKAIADRGGPAVLNDLIESTKAKLDAYSAKQDPTTRDYLDAVPLVGSSAAKAYDQVQAGNYKGAAGTAAGTIGSMLLPEFLPGAVRGIADGAPEAGAIARDAASGAYKGATGSALRPLGVPIPDVINYGSKGSAAGALVSHATFGTIPVPVGSGIGAAVGMSIPVIKGSIAAVKQGIADRAGAAKVAASIEETNARRAAEDPDAMPAPDDVAPPAFASTPGALPSGRVPGPAPIQAPAPVAPRSPRWQNIAPSTPAEQAPFTPTPGALPSGRVPGQFTQAPPMPGMPAELAAPPESVPAPAVPDAATLDAISRAQNKGKSFAQSSGAEKELVLMLANRAMEASKPRAVTSPVEAAPVVSPAMEPAAAAVPEWLTQQRAAFDKARGYNRPVNTLADGTPLVDGNRQSVAAQNNPAAVQMQQGNETSGLQIPQVVAARSRVAQGLAQHLHDAGISSEHIDALEAGDKNAFDDLWDAVGKIPGVSRQSKYSPSYDTIFDARSALEDLEKAKAAKR